MKEFCTVYTPNFTEIHCMLWNRKFKINFRSK